MTYHRTGGKGGTASNRNAKLPNFNKTQGRMGQPRGRKVTERKNAV